MWRYARVDLCRTGVRRPVAIKNDQDIVSDQRGLSEDEGQFKREFRSGCSLDELTLHGWKDLHRLTFFPLDNILMLIVET